MFSLCPLILCLSFVGTVLSEKPIIYNDLPCKFSLAAHNVTRHNVNSTGLPLVLGQYGASDGASFEVTSTYASYPYNLYPTIALSNGSLRAYRASGAWLTNATAVASGGPLLWFTSALFNHDAARVYNAVQCPGAALPVLATNGATDRWSLCPFNLTGQTNIVFNVSGSAAEYKLGFDPRECWKVAIHLVPLEGEC
ncbi:hypothetical protein DFH07DRAFT_826061 [Mycena maculata]|uniref:Uncharacterized protein n=1 Tax=Mycena maculata TaxID=230809 RepID=A0AAD7IW84_9AGAR|nr:hypothetical protein DFH07DRAFT_826061 [Mycena maculata]